MLLSTGERAVVRAVRDGDQRPRPPRDLADRARRPGSSPTPRTPRRGSSRCAPTASARALDEDRDRARRRLPGRLDRARRHDARPRRLGHDRGRARRRGRRRGLRDLHRRPRRLQRRPADRPRRAQAAGRLVRRDARDGGLGRRRAAAAQRRVRAQPRRAHPLPIELRRRRRYLCRRRAGDRWNTRSITAVTHSTGEARVTLHGRAGHARRRRPRHHRARRGEREHRHDHPERAASPRARAPTCRSPSRATTCAPRSTALEPLAAELGIELVSDEAMGKVSIVGAGMRRIPASRRRCSRRSARRTSTSR